MHRRRSPRSLSFALEALRDSATPATALAEVQRAWPQAVGGAIAAEALPTAERAGVLTVSCSAAVWAQELDLMAPVILERLNELLNGARIERLRCVTAGAGGRYPNAAGSRYPKRAGGRYPKPPRDF